MSAKVAQPRPIWPLLGALLWAVLGFFGLGPAMMSPMMFDAPGSQETPGIWAAFWGVVAFPVVAGLAFLGLGLCWWLSAKRDVPDGLMWALFLLPLLPIVSVVRGFLVMGG